MKGTRSVERAREDFPILSTEMNGRPLVFLDSAASSQKPISVIQAINYYYREQNANVHRGVYALSQKATDLFEMGRRRVRDFINAPSEKEIIFVRGATEAINLVAQSYGGHFFREGQEIILSQLEHHSNIVPWQLIAEKKGMQIRVIPVNKKGELQIEILEEWLSENTAIVAVNHISNALGTINPVREIIAKARNFDVPVLIDGAQAMAHGPVDVQELGADFYVFSGHKMFGPTGVGVLWGREELLEKMPPWQGGGEMIHTVSFEKTTYNELPFKFEAGTPNIAGVIGLSEAIAYLGEFNFEEIAVYEKGLLDYCVKKLTQIPGMQLVGTAKSKASVVSFLVDGLHPYDVGIILDKMGIAVRTGHHCTQPLMEYLGIPGTIRASMAFYNNREDVDRLVEGVAKAQMMLS
ncbi:MAG: cysteine desulfurase [Saprospirales bacterium]|nr:MAG: cysteine desulfurase [Saprospirales bacterium]